MKKDSRSVRLYRELLRLYPPAYQKRFSEEMLEVFRQCDAEAALQSSGRFHLWAAVLRELPSNLIHEYTNRKELMKHPHKLALVLATVFLAPFFTFILIVAGSYLTNALNNSIFYCLI